MATWSDVLTDGFTEYAVRVDDRTAVAEFGLLMRDLGEELQRIVGPTDRCALAFVAMIIRPEIRVPCIVAVMEDRTIVAWKKGLLRKIAQSEVIPRVGVSRVEFGRGSSSATRNARVATIHHSSGTTSFALSPCANAGLEMEIYRQVTPLAVESPMERVSPESAWRRTASGVHAKHAEAGLVGPTSFVNPESPKPSQMAQLMALTWLPASVVQTQMQAIDRGYSFEATVLPPDRLSLPLPLPTAVEVTPGIAWASPVASYIWPTFTGAGQLALEQGERVVATWDVSSASGYWVEDDLKPSWGFNLVPDKNASRYSWSLTTRRLALTSLMPDASSGMAAMHIRFEWICGLNLETYDHLGEKENTTSIEVVCGTESGKRASIGVNTGHALDSSAVEISHAIQRQLIEFGLTADQARERVSDNGKKGSLKFCHFPIRGGLGLTMPSGIVGDSI